MIPDDGDGDEIPAYKITTDSEKLANLLKRQKTYGDITQNATASQIERLLVNIQIYHTQITNYKNDKCFPFIRFRNAFLYDFSRCYIITTFLK